MAHRPNKPDPARYRTLARVIIVVGCLLALALAKGFGFI